jgi:hypothetical protein
MSDAQAVSSGAAAGTGTLRVFKRLRRDKANLVQHGFGTMPLVDVYELTSFEVVASADEMSDAQRVQFYVYHTRDASAQVRGPDGFVRRITVDDGESRALRIPFDQALRIAGVRYDDRSTLGDVVVEFWSAFFREPSDTFDETDYGNSPWLDAAVGDRRTVAELKRGGGWDELFLQFRPRKTLNWPLSVSSPYIRQPIGDQVMIGDKPMIDGMAAINTGITIDERVAMEEKMMLQKVALERPAFETTATSTGVAQTGTRSDWGSPPGVDVMQVGLNTVALTLRDGGPDEVNVMVLLRP